MSTCDTCLFWERSDSGLSLGRCRRIPSESDGGTPVDDLACACDGEGRAALYTAAHFGCTLHRHGWAEPILDLGTAAWSINQMLLHVHSRRVTLPGQALESIAFYHRQAQWFIVKACEGVD